jgi:hypothetical protein
MSGLIGVMRVNFVSSSTGASSYWAAGDDLLDPASDQSPWGSRWTKRRLSPTVENYLRRRAEGPDT